MSSKNSERYRQNKLKLITASSLEELLRSLIDQKDLAVAEARRRPTSTAPTVFHSDVSGVRVPPFISSTALQFPAI